MPTQIIPIEGIDKLGLIADQPAVNIPPGAWSDVSNVRFDDGAIRKIKGHIEIFDDHGLTNIQHIAYWENPNTRYYIVINRTTVDTVYTLELESTGDTILVSRGEFDTPTVGQRDSWQSLQFNGGFTIIVNNGLVAPEHITAQTGTDLADAVQFAVLTNWQSYTPTGLAAVTSVTANIIIAEGNVLLAGGLVERDTNGDLVRNLNSVVRVSDVAAPGTIPDNWNPFDTTGTADEIIISDTGLITAMLPLRGSVYVYTSDTITALRITPQGLRSSVITKEYGALSQAAVFEFKGQHIVIGSDDIYIFSGNPGDIKSIADGRVRKFFYDNLHASFLEDMQIIRNQAFDELWICFANLDSGDGSYNEALIWNYTDNVWTKRDLPDVQNMAVGPIPGAGSARTVVTIPDGTTGALDASTAATADIEITGDVSVDFDPGVRDVQTITLGGTKNNDFTASSDQFFLRLPNNFLTPSTGTTSTWEFDPDENDGVYDTMIAATTYSDGLDVTDALAEMSTAMVALTGTGTPAEAITTSIDTTGTDPDVVNVDDTPADITFQLDNGEGPVGAFDALVYAGQNSNLGDRVIETGVDLVNNEGMVFVATRTNNANTYLYDTINGANMRFRIDESNNAIVTQNDALDDFRTDGWLLDAGSGQVDGLNAEGQDYLSWTMQSGADFFDVVEYTGGAGTYPTGVIEFQGTTQTYTVVASGASGNQLNAGQASFVVVGGGGGGAADAQGGQQTGGGGGGALSWVTLNLVAGDVIQTSTGAAGTFQESNGGSVTVAGTDGGDSTVSLNGTVVARAGGGEHSRVGGNGAGGTRSDITNSAIVAQGGGNGGAGGNRGSAGSGAGGGAGGYNGDGGAGAVGANPGNQIGSSATANSGGGAGGNSGSSGDGYGGGGVGIFGIGVTGESTASATTTQGQPGSGGVGGTATTVAGGNFGGGGARTGSGGAGASRIVNGSGVTYATTVAGTNGVRNELINSQSHTLTSAPGMMWVKARDSTQVWTVWHRDLALEPNQNDDSYIQLSGQNQTTGGDGDNFANTRPTATDFFVGNAAGGGDGRTNGSNATYYNYLFGSDELTTSDHALLNGNDPDPDGNIYCGSYTNGTAVPGGTIGGIAFFVELGWKPSVMLTKNTGDSQPWSIHFLDPAGGNGGTNTFGSRFGYPHTSTPWAELLRFIDVGDPDGVGGTATAAGFTVRSTSDEINPGGSNDSVIFMAIREPQGPAALPGLVSDEPVFTGTGAADNVVTTGVDARFVGNNGNAGGFTFFGAGASGGSNVESPYVLNNFGTINAGNQAGAEAGNRYRLPRLNSWETGTFPLNDNNPVATFQVDGFTLLAPTATHAPMNTSGRTQQVFSFADAPGLMSTSRYTSSSLTGRFTIPHTLGEKPQMVLIKNLTNDEPRSGSFGNPQAYPWNVFHRVRGNNLRLSTSLNPDSGGLSANGWLQLEGLDEATGVSIATNDILVWTGANADDYVVYAFGGKDVDGAASNVVTADDGTLAAGGAIGIGSGSVGEVINLGWRPGFVMVKAVAGASNLHSQWRYWGQEDGFASVRQWSNSDAKSNEQLTVTDNGFTANVEGGAEYIYWCSRDSIPDAAALPDFDLYNLDGTSVELSEAGRTAIASGRGNEAAVRTAINAATTSGVTYTAAGRGRILISLRMYGQGQVTLLMRSSTAMPRLVP